MEKAVGNKRAAWAEAAFRNLWLPYFVLLSIQRCENDQPCLWQGKKVRTVAVPMMFFSHAY